MKGHKVCFSDKYEYLSLNYPCYFFLSGALKVLDKSVFFKFLNEIYLINKISIANDYNKRLYNLCCDVTSTSFQRSGNYVFKMAAPLQYLCANH